MVKIKMVENPSKVKNTRSNVTTSDSTSHSSTQEDFSGWKSNVSFNWDEMFDSIDAEVSENGNVEAANALRAMVRFFLVPSSPYSIKNSSDKISALEKKVDEEEVELETLKKKLKGIQSENQKNKEKLKKQTEKLSIDKYKTRVTLSNISLTKGNSKDSFEPVEETTKTVSELLKLAGQSLGSVKEYKRLYPKPKKDTNGDESSSTNSSSTTTSTSTSDFKQRDPKILLDFQSMSELKKFTSKLREIKNQEKFGSLSLSNDCPNFG